MDSASPYHGDGDAVKYLIDTGADVNAKAADGLTPLHMAASIFKGNEGKENITKEYSKYDIFRLVMDAGADLTATTNDGWTALHSAVANAYTGWRGNPDHSLQRIEDLIKAGVGLETKDANGRTPLHWASMQGYLLYSGVPSVKANAAELLIENGADIQATDKNGDTPLHLATKMGYPEIVLALVKAGAKSDLKNHTGETPKTIAGNAKDETLLYIFDNAGLPGAADVSVDLRKNSKEYKWGPELVKAAWRGDVAEVQRLLEIGADLEYRDMDGFNALERARDSGHEEIVKLLKKEMQK
ncbi:MAG: ankyrin repeat domain-containing protein [Prolixibacteraceae bacterium]